MLSIWTSLKFLASGKDLMSMQLQIFNTYAMKQENSKYALSMVDCLSTNLTHYYTMEFLRTKDI